MNIDIQFWESILKIKVEKLVCKNVDWRLLIKFQIHIRLDESKVLSWFYFHLSSSNVNLYYDQIAFI